MSHDQEIDALCQAIALASDPAEEARLRKQLDLLIESRVQRARSVPVAERR